MTLEDIGTAFQVIGLLIAVVAAFIGFGLIVGLFALSASLFAVGTALQTPQKAD